MNTKLDVKVPIDLSENRRILGKYLMLNLLRGI